MWRFHADLNFHFQGWGQSIVEFLDFEDLAPALHARNRSTFFVTIQNLNVVSGIASPPNALAII